MTVRVTRLMEYEYESVESALTDMQNWAVPASGVRKFSAAPSRIIRSAVIGPVFGEAAERIHSAIADVESDDRLPHLIAAARAWREATACLPEGQGEEARQLRLALRAYEGEEF